MTQAEFEALVRRVLRRGTVYDADIPVYAAQALRSLESMHNWRHMWRESFEQTLVAADDQITFAGVLKSVRYLRFHVPTTSSSSLAGRYAYAKKSQPEDITVGATFSGLHKVKFWMTTPQILQMNGAFDQDVIYDVGWYLRSTYGDSCPWFDVAPTILVMQTIVEMAALHRDDKQTGRAGMVLKDTFAALSESDLIHQFDSDDATMVPFFDELEEDLFSSSEGGLT